MIGCGRVSSSHRISRESGSTPLGRLTLHVSVYDVPTTPDPSPDTTTSGDSAATECIYKEFIFKAQKLSELYTSNDSHRTGKVYQSH